MPSEGVWLDSSTRSAGPPSAATIAWKRSAAVPSARAATRRFVASSTSAATPPRTSISAPSAITTSVSRWSSLAPTNQSMVSRTSRALPAVCAQHLVHVGQQRGRRRSPAPPATATMLCASSSAWPRSLMNAPLPKVTSMTKRVEPGSKLLRQDRRGDQRRSTRPWPLHREWRRAGRRPARGRTFGR